MVFLSSALAFVIGFYGLGAALKGWGSRRGAAADRADIWFSIDNYTSTVVSSFIIAVFVILGLQYLGMVDLGPIPGTPWGMYLVGGSLAANTIIVVGLAVTFVTILGIQVLIRVPFVTRLLVRIVGESQWLVDFMEWADMRRRATIEGAKWILSHLQRLFRW
jgi:hypothetical protein